MTVQEAGERYAALASPALYHLLITGRLDPERYQQSAPGHGGTAGSLAGAVGLIWRVGQVERVDPDESHAVVLRWQLGVEMEISADQNGRDFRSPCRFGLRCSR